MNTLKKIGLFSIALFFFDTITAQDRLVLFEERLESVEIIELTDFLNNRRRNYSQIREINKQLSTLFGHAYALTEEEALQCIEHKNPKLRALGLLGLYTFNDFSYLKIIHSYLSDSAYCFKKNPYHYYRFYSNPVPPPTKYDQKKAIKKAPPLSVGDIALQLLNFYAQHASYLAYQYSNSGSIDWPAYFEKYEAKEYNLGFFQFLKRKASGGTFPPPKNRNKYIEDFKNRIEKMEDHRIKAIYKLYLSNVSFTIYQNLFPVYEDSVLVSVLKQLDKETIKSILKGDLKIKDVDLNIQYETQLWTNAYKNMCIWILLHLEEVFGEEDVAFLLEQAQQEEQNKFKLHSAIWYIASARLEPIKADQYLKMGIKKYSKSFDFDNQCFLYAELWRLSGEKEIALILDWFYTTFYPKKSFYASCFLDRVDLELLKNLVTDERFYTNITNSNTLSIANRINQLRKQLVIPEQYTKNIWEYNPNFDKKTKRELKARVQLLKAKIRAQFTR